MLSLEWRDNISPTEAFDGVSPVLSAPQTSILTARDLGFSACRVMGGSYCSTSPRSKGSVNRRDSITLIVRVNIRFTTEDERKFRAATAFVKLLQTTSKVLGEVLVRLQSRRQRLRGSSKVVEPRAAVCPV